MEAEIAPAAPKPKRRWFQFSLATLLLLTLGCAVVLGLWVSAAERQRRAVAFLRGLGGQVVYSGEVGLRAPEWLRRRLGDDYFESVEAIDLRGTQVSDAGLAHLESLTALESLYLGGTQVTDAGLAHLESLTALESLDLRGTQVGDAGLAHVESLAALERLYLSGTQVSDGGLIHLKGLTALKELDLGGTQVSDAGLAHVESLAALERKCCACATRRLATRGWRILSA